MSIKVIILLINNAYSRWLASALNKLNPNITSVSIAYEDEIPMSEDIIKEFMRNRTSVLITDQETLNSMRLSVENLTNIIHPFQIILITKKIQTHDYVNSFFYNIIILKKPKYGATNIGAYFSDVIIKLHDKLKRYSHNIDFSNNKLILDSIDIDSDELNEIIACLFYDKHKITVRLLESISDLNSHKRTNSILLFVEQDNFEPVILKISSKERIKRENQRYTQFIKGRLKYHYHSHIEKCVCLWNAGGLIYSLAWTGNIMPITFADYYAQSSPENITVIIRSIFNNVLNRVYKEKIITNKSLFEQYEDSWSHNGDSYKKIEKLLENHPHLNDKEIYIKSLGMHIFNPFKWVHENHEVSTLHDMELYITHGDLHSENILIDENNNCWLIDFDRSGFNPRLQDFIELETDIVNKLLKTQGTKFLEMLVDLTSQATPDIVTPIINSSDSDIIKSTTAIGNIRILAHKTTNYQDMREYYWGLLLNNLFLANYLGNENERHERAIIYASILAQRLDDWKIAFQPPIWPRKRNKPITISVQLPIPPHKIFANGHALLIGVSEYVKIGHILETIALDARDVGGVLTSPDLAGYPTTQVHQLTGIQATRSAILRALDTLATQLRTTPQATVLLLFGGHGKQLDGRYVLLPADYDPGDPIATTIDAGTLKQKLDAIARNAQKVVVLLNCCYSGGVGDGVLDPTLGDGAPPVAFSTPLAEGSGRVVISSARPGERAGAESDRDATHSVFGAQLLAGLRGGAPGTGEHVMLFDLFRFLSQEVPLDAQSITDPATGLALEQHPELYARSVGQDFALTLRPTT